MTGSFDDFYTKGWLSLVAETVISEQHMVLVFSLIGGLLVAVVLQLVFADLGIALGLSLIDLSPDRSALADGDKSEVNESQNTLERDNPRASESDFSLPITHLLGFVVAVSLSLVIFVGTLLSVELSGLLEPRRGVIFGLVFWSAYWLLFIWLCSTTITGIADSLIGGAIASGRRLISTVKQSLSTSDQPSDSVFDTVVEQQAVIKELAEEVSELANQQRKIPNLLDSQKDTLISQVNTAIDTAIDARLEENKLKERALDSQASSEPSQSGPSQSETSKIEATATETSLDVPSAVAASSSQPGLLSELPSWQQIARSAIDQVDLSDWDIETLLQQISTDMPRPDSVASQIKGSATALLPKESSQEASDSTSEDFLEISTETLAEYDAALKAIQTKLEDYCRYTNLSALTPEKLSEKVCSQLQEHALSAKDILNIERVSPKRTLDVESIEAVLMRRQKLPTENRQALLSALELSWPSPLLEAESTQEDTSNREDNPFDLSVRSFAQETYQSVYQAAYQTVDKHLQSIDWDTVSLEDVKPEVNNLLNQLEKEGSLDSLDWQALVSRIEIHHDIKEDLTDWLKTTLASKLQSVRPVVSHTARDLSKHVSEQITDYLSNREKPDLHPVEAAEELSQIVGGMVAALPHPSKLADLSSLDISFDRVLWDKGKWQRALENRKDMTTAEIHQIIDWGEQVWQPKAQQISSWLRAMQAEVNEHMSLPDRERVVNMAEQVSEQISEQIETVQEAALGQMVSVKEDVQAQATAVKADIQTRVDSGRRQIAIAAWWLFIAFVSSGSAAASAGWLATIY